MSGGAHDVTLGPLTVNARPCVAPECARIENHSARAGTIAPVVIAQVPQMGSAADELAFWGCAIRVLIDQVAQGAARRMERPDLHAELGDALLQFVIDRGAPGESDFDRGVYEVAREVRPEAARG